MRPSLLIPVVLASCSLALANPQNSDQRDGTRSKIRKLDGEVTYLAKQLGDWSEQYDVIQDAIDNIWGQNGWNSEADRFARKTALQVSRIPPWNFQARMEAFSGALKQRYKLTGEQKTKADAKLRNEVFKMTLKYAPTFFEQAKEMLATRAQKRPFTSAQVARWVRQSDPLMDDWIADLRRITSEFRETLTEDQRKIFDRDLESMNKRIKHFVSAREEWKQGKWDPSDWGLQNDAIHRKAAERASPYENLSMEDILVKIATDESDESSWRKYVKRFIGKYSLDEAQSMTALAILEELELRAQQYRAANEKEIAEISRRERSTHALLKPIRDMFEELKLRLDLIPTDLQRKQASDATNPRPDPARRPPTPARPKGAPGGS